MGAENGVPCMANDGAAKAYVHSLGEALHYEFKPLGVYVTVLAAGVTNTAVNRQIRPRSENHADETDERRAMRI